MTHGHEILHMMVGNLYQNKDELIKVIIDKFGADERFRTCSVEGMTAQEIVEFFDQHDKLIKTEQGITVNVGNVCQH